MQDRSARRRSQAAAAPREHGVRQLPWRAVANPYRPVEVLREEQVEAIHLASLRILKEIGINILLPEARTLLAEAGADVRAGSERVRFDPGLIEAAVAKAPAGFLLHARNPAHSRWIGGAEVSFTTVASAPYCSDLERGRRPGTLADMTDFVKLAQALNILHLVTTYPVEPQDVDPRERHLVAIEATILNTDKPYAGYSLGRRRILDVMDMTRLARGRTEAEFAAEPSLYTIVNANSPLQFDGPMLWGVIEMARQGQVVVVTPFTLAGAMAPVTLAGALAQQNAEALAGIAICQLVRPGAPVVYGGFCSNVDMRTGAPCFGTPEYVLASQAAGQMARRYRVPYRSSNTCGANAPELQATYESMMSLWGSVMGGANIVLHAAGWLEGGLCASFEKMIIDAELLQGVAQYLVPLEVSESTLALDAIADVGPAGHFFGTPHTLERFRTAFYEPLLSNRQNYQSWEAAGSETDIARANRVWKRLLADWQAPPFEPAAKDALTDFVARRRAAGGATADAM